MSYTFSSSDCGTLVTFSNSSVTATLPNGGLGNGWSVDVGYTGTGSLTISSAAHIDGSTAALTLAPGEGVRIFTDNTNYWTQRGGAGLTANDTGGYVPLYACNGALGNSSLQDNGSTVSTTENLSIGAAGTPMSLCWDDATMPPNQLCLQNVSSGLNATLNLFTSLGNNVLRDPFAAMGKPEPLRHELRGCWSGESMESIALSIRSCRRRSESSLADITTEAGYLAGRTPRPAERSVLTPRQAKILLLFSIGYREMLSLTARVC
jgi:hypothetical protein